MAEDKQYLQFTEQDQQGKTKRYAIENKVGITLGYIRWNGAWRKYCFFTLDSRLFDNKCLMEIVQFMDRLNKEHKDGKTL
jgi:hypothetical protein